MLQKQALIISEKHAFIILQTQALIISYEHAFIHLQKRAALGPPRGCQKTAPQAPFLKMMNACITNLIYNNIDNNC